MLLFWICPRDGLFFLMLLNNMFLTKILIKELLCGQPALWHFSVLVSNLGENYKTFFLIFSLFFFF